MSRLRQALGCGVGALIASGLLGLVASALYLRIRNSGESSYAQVPASAYARKLAGAALRQLEGEPGADLQKLIARLRQLDPSLKRASVVAEPKSAKYRFLRKRRYLAIEDAARAGQALDAARPEDKTVYDVATRVRLQGAMVTNEARPGEPLRVTAALSVRVGGKHLATAVVVTEPRGGLNLEPAWPIGATVLGCTLLGFFLGAFASRRRRYLSLLVLLATTAALHSKFLDLVHSRYAYAVSQEQGRLTSALNLESGGLAELATSPVLTAPGWALLLATLAAVGIALLGLLGVGVRLAAALRQHRFAYAYVLPAGLGMLLLVFVPFGYGLGLGFFDHAHGTYTFVGLRNFVEILSGGGHSITHPMNFYFTLGVTVLWTGANVLLHTAIGLGLALLLKDPLLRFKGIYRVLLVLPWAVPNYITALIWKGMFHQQYGAVNHTLALLGVDKVSWFSSFGTAFCANLVTNTWLGFPFMMVVSLGALQSIPKDVYEAAAVDGASPWQCFRRITLPLLRPALFPAIILGSIWTFNMFNIIYLVSEGAPGGSTDILITEAYRWAFERADRYGLAAAYALLIFVILFAYTLFTNRLTKATEDVVE